MLYGGFGGVCVSIVVQSPREIASDSHEVNLVTVQQSYAGGQGIEGYFGSAAFLL